MCPVNLWKENMRMYRQWKRVSMRTSQTMSYRQTDQRKSPCPVRGCDYLGVIWDNPQPSVRLDKEDEVHRLRADILRYLSECIVGWRSLDDLVNWIHQQRRMIPRSCRIIPRARDQMRSLARSLGWEDPEWFTMIPVNSPAVLIHWRYQAVLL